MSIEDFTKGVEAIVGVERAEFNSNEISNYLQNVCAKNRKVTAIIFPHTENEIAQLIRLGRKNKIPLYPISKGLNFGLGSRLPVEDNHVIVDLSKMNRILYFDSDLGVMCIEPGVSQHEVAKYLQEINADFVLNVTGSSANSSVMGNAIERGVGHYGSRVSEVINIDIILGNGDKISTGLGNPEQNSSFYSYPHGLGADLKGLFFQSNFGIATAMTIRLLPKTQSTAIINLEKLDSIPLELFINQLRIAKQRNILPENLHISNKMRRLSVVTPLIAREQNLSIMQASIIAKEHIQSDWAATVSLRGDRDILQAQIKSLNIFFKNSARFSVLFDPNIDDISDPFLGSIRGTIGHALGIPCGDALLSLGYEFDTLLDCPLEQSDIGTRFVIPVLPFRGQDFIKIIDCINNRFKKYKFQSYMTFNLIEHINLEGVINLVFSKLDKSSAEKAHVCISEVTSSLEELGYPPMRLSIFQKSNCMSEENNKNKLKKQLKQIFDPDNIIARGRYE
jgi:4-cresol dehydrogenase (hydroxylating)